MLWIDYFAQIGFHRFKKRERIYNVYQLILCLHILPSLLYPLSRSTIYMKREKQFSLFFLDNIIYMEHCTVHGK